MSALVERAYAKLNLALHVRGRMPDGRHEIETLFAFCEHGDELTAEDADEISLEVLGPFAGQLPESGDNLVVRAARALQQDSGVDRGARLRLTKTLPVASGIGGGSADSAAALRLLTRLWGLDPHVAEAIAPKIGSDVPACLRSFPCRGTGAGDRLDAVDLHSLSGTPVLLVNPGKPLSTAAVFGAWDGIDRGPLESWQEGRNDLEAPARSLVPDIAELLEWLRAQPGAALSRMSGSGATCFALFHGSEARDSAAALVPPAWWHLATKLR